ncbi:MAG: hypothetical protein HZB51_05195 [Chloroflexi bacterium]|nr:hypothetical protein [Chloroflexota bacterium]
MRKKHIGFVLLLAVVVVTIFFFANPRRAEAQCGSAASSCKSCHEVQKVAPVNAKGAWHTQHAFGDFCAFCHSGNTKSKDKTAAHTGMLDPLADVKGACQSCHPNDYMDRAKKYADTLGKTIGTGTGSSVTPINSSGTTSSGDISCGPAAPTGGQTINLNKVYAGLDEKMPNVLGNAILIGLILVVALVLAGLMFYYEKPLPRGIAAFRQLLAMPVATSASTISRPELSSLLPLLSSSDPGTVRAVTQLLSDYENGPRILKALSHLDLRALVELGESDQKALTSLLTLARELKS